MPKYILRGDVGDGQEAVYIYSKDSGEVCMALRCGQLPGHPWENSDTAFACYDQNNRLTFRQPAKDYIVMSNLLEITANNRYYLVAAKDVIRFDGKRVYVRGGTPLVDLSNWRKQRVKGTPDRVFSFSFSCYHNDKNEEDAYDQFFPEQSQNNAAPAPQFAAPSPQQPQQQHSAMPQEVGKSQQNLWPTPKAQRSALPQLAPNQLYGGCISLRLSDGKIVRRRPDGTVEHYEDIAHYLNPEDAYFLMYNLRNYFKTCPDSTEVPVNFWVQPPADRNSTLERPYVAFAVPKGPNSKSTLMWAARNSGHRDMLDLVNPSSVCFMAQDTQAAINEAKAKYDKIRIDKTRLCQTKNGGQIPITFDDMLGDILKNQKFLSLTQVEQHKLLVHALRYLSDWYQRAFADAVRKNGTIARGTNFKDFFSPGTPMGKVRQKIMAYSAYLRDFFPNSPFSSTHAPFRANIRLANDPDGMPFDGLNGFIPGHYNPQTKEFEDGCFRFCDLKSGTFVEFSQQELYNAMQNLCGFTNIGSTCWMNSLTQAFLADPILLLFLRKLDTTKLAMQDISGKAEPSLEHYFSDLAQEAEKKQKEKGSHAFVEPYGFRRAIARNSLFNEGQASDSKDFFIYIGEQMHKDTCLPSTLLPSYPGFTPNQYDLAAALAYFQESLESSPISAIFFGHLLTTNDCQNYLNPHAACHNAGIYNFQIIPLEEARNVRNRKILQDAQSFLAQNWPLWMVQNWLANAVKAPITMRDAISYLEKPQLFTGENKNYCNMCHQLEDSIYQTMMPIETLPTNLVLILNRGRGNMYNVPDAMPDAVHFTSDSGEERYYVQSSLVCHMGESGPNAHFVNETLDRTQPGGILFNDAFTTPPQKGSPDGLHNAVQKSWTRYIPSYQRVTKEAYWSYINSQGVTHETIHLPSTRYLLARDMLRKKYRIPYPTRQQVLTMLYSTPISAHCLPDTVLTPDQLEPGRYKTMQPQQFNQWQFNNGNNFNQFNNGQFNNQQVKFNNGNNFNQFNNGQFNNAQQMVNFNNNGLCYCAAANVPHTHG